MLKKVQSIKAAYEAEDIDLRLRSRCSKLKNNKRRIRFRIKEADEQAQNKRSWKEGSSPFQSKGDQHPEPSFITGLSDGQ